MSPEMYAVQDDHDGACMSSGHLKRPCAELGVHIAMFAAYTLCTSAYLMCSKTHVSSRRSQHACAEMTKQALLHSKTHLHVVTSVESFKIKLFVRFGRPEPQVDCVVGGKSRNRIVMRNCCHTLASIPSGPHTRNCSPRLHKDAACWTVLL